MIDLVSADIQDFQKRQFVNLTIKCQYIDRYVPYDRGLAYAFWKFPKIVGTNVKISQMGTFRETVRDVENMII